MKRKLIIVYTTCASRKEALQIAESLLKKRLIACANMIPGVESKFWWNGKIDKAKEILLMMKTQRRNFRKIEKEIKHLHSYKVPEMIALPIVEGSGEYLDWIDENIS